MQNLQIHLMSNDTPKESAFGIAHKYANPALIEKEKEAFEADTMNYYQ